MKKVLLLSAVALCASQVQAVEPTVLENVTINNLSPDGKWGASDTYGAVIIFNFDTGKKYEFVPDPEDYMTYYSLGSGNCISNTGAVVGGISLNDASVCIDGEWVSLKASCTDGTRTAYSITPDGNRIVGMVAPMGSDGFTGLLSIPGYWDRNDDGTYSDFKQLPYPVIDFTNRIPQYISAASVSDDGKFIVGQVRDNTGMWHCPILFRQDEKGEWSYEIYHQELLNPTGVKFPSPEEILPEVESLDIMDYMTDSQKEAYQFAVDNYDWVGDYPEPEDYIGEEEYKEYLKDNAPYIAWFKQFEEIEAGIEECRAAGAVNFTFNNVHLSGNGNYFAMTSEKTVEIDDPLSWMPFKTIYAPCVFNIEKDEYKFYDNDIVVSFVSKNGDVLASSFGTDAMYTSAYILRAGDADFIPLEKYVEQISPETAKWMKDNMTHSCTVGMDDNYQPVYEEVMVTGLPTASSDLTTFATWTETWSFEEMINAVDDEYPSMISYMFTIDNPAGVSAPSVADAISVKVTDGAILVNGDAASLEVYDLNGRLVMNVANPGSAVETNLASGFYIVKAVAANGDVVTVKAAL